MAGASAVLDGVKRVHFSEVRGSGLAAVYSNVRGDIYARIDPQVDFDWSVDAPQLSGDTLDVTWTGVIIPSVSGRYVLQLQTGGDAVLVLDGRTLINQRGRVPAISDGVELEAAHRYAFTLTCVNTPMMGSTQLLWYPDGLPPRVIPQAAFYPVTDRRRAAGH